jgi:exodeoxyribonuclease V alpha subunit
VIESEPERLLKVPGIGEKKISLIKEAWAEQRNIKDVMLFLKSHNVSTGYAIKIYKEYGKDAIERVKNDPYGMVYDIDGVGFRIVDKIAQDVGVEPHNVNRLKAGVEFILNEASRSDGHIYLPLQELVEKSGEILGVESSEIAGAIEKLAQVGLVVIENQNVYLLQYHYSEVGIAEKIKEMLNIQHDKLNESSLFSYIDQIEQEQGIEFAPHQTEAILKAFKEPMLILTGGPGTGKSTSILGIIRAAERFGLQVALAAPTGRAAKRMQELTGVEAKTIHRLLEFDPVLHVFRRDDSTPLQCDMLIVDETSMVDTLLMYGLLKAVPNSTRLVLVGDVDQLPSVGAGDVLRDLIESRTITTIRLQTIFRQAKESKIITNSHVINHGEFPEFGGDFVFVDCNKSEDIPGVIEELVARKIPKSMGYNPVDDIQVLSPMYNSAAGVNNLNLILQKSLNPKGEACYRRGDKVIKAGDKVMQIKNNYEKDVFNGDIGRVEGFDEEESILLINFDKRIVEYDFNELDDIVVAYAATIHKSQGCEYKCVVLPVTLQHSIMLQRNLIYTAVTRAKELLYMVGSKHALNIAIQNDRIRMRYTGLKKRIA